MKNRSLLSRKLALFYVDVSKMRTQTDREFAQNDIKELNKK